MKKIVSVLLILSLLCMTPIFFAEEVLTTENKGIFAGHTYKLFDEKLLWEEAKEYCEKMGGHLATITSEDENNYLAGLIPEDMGYIIGMHRDITGYKKWVTGEEVIYSNWADGQPDNRYGKQVNLILCNKPYWYTKSENCWDDSDDYVHGFICEWDYVLSSFGSEISQWASEEIEKAYDSELIPEALIGEDLTKPITRAEFAAVSVKAYEKMANTEALPVINNPFKDTNDVEVLKALNMGITAGVSESEFAPNALLNREMAATMLTRVFKRATMKGWSLENDEKFKLDYKKGASFADDDRISAWAKDSVYFMAANEIINGVGGNKFAPQNITSEEEATAYANATREQALIIATRMVDKLK